MNDDVPIVLPTLPSAPEWVQQYASTFALYAIKADRERRKEPEKLEKYGFWRSGGGLAMYKWHDNPANPWLFVLCLQGNRYWIESERNRELAKALRERTELWPERLREPERAAADALDGGAGA